MTLITVTRALPLALEIKQALPRERQRLKKPTKVARGFPPGRPLRATHAVSTIVTKIAVAIAHGDRTAIVATRRITLEAGELVVA
jgi:hypothetical protein